MWIAFVRLSGSGVRALVRNRNMAGLYQGYHSFPNKAGSIEIFWRADGWCWVSRSRSSTRGRTYWTIPNKHRSLSQREVCMLLASRDWPAIKAPNTEVERCSKSDPSEIGQ